MWTRSSSILLAAAVAVVGCGGTPAPASSPGQTQAKNVGTVAFQSSQGQPVNEAEGMRKQVLPGFNGTASFDSSLTDGQMTDKIWRYHKPSSSCFACVPLPAPRGP